MTRDTNLSVPKAKVLNPLAKELLKPSGRRFDVAVFPLLDSVLFPGVSLPLHILEQRYAQMLQELRAREWSLAISLVTPRDGSDFFLNTICGAGSVQISRAYEDGRADIIVHGEMRVKLHSFIQKEPYFVMEAEELAPVYQGSEVCEKTEKALIEALTGDEKKEISEVVELAKMWAFLNPSVPDQAAMAFDEFESPGALCDFFAFHYLKKPLDKQIYLNCLDPLQRALMLSEYLRTDLSRLSRKVEKNKRTALIH
jgi:Lon protease-like protein